jgi:diguanylate cyclase (GGDEF)-like protein/PAS domain S-box-containing protein
MPLNRAVEVCRGIAGSMARYRGAEPTNELVRRVHAALGCDASVLLERTGEFSAICRFCEEGDAMLSSLTQPDSILEALKTVECVFHNDYLDVPGGDSILKAWGARTMAILPAGQPGKLGTAMVLLWRTPNRLPADFQEAIDPVWALLQVIFPCERSLRDLEEVREQLSAILETIPQAVGFVDNDGQRGWINRQAGDLLGLPPGVVHPAQFSEAMRKLRASVSNAEQVQRTGEQLLRDPNAEIRDWVWELPEPWRVLSVASRITRVRHVEGRIWVFADITAKRTMDIALEESRRFSERILSITPNIIYVYDVLERKVLYSNPRVFEVLGITAGDVQEMDDPVRTRCHPDDLARLREHYVKCLKAAEGQVHEVECRLRHADGSWRWLLIRASQFLSNPAGEVTQILGIAGDISERVAVEEHLREQEQRWQLALAGTNDGIWDWNAVTGEVFYSPRWKEMLGYGVDELPDTARVWEELVHPEDLPQARERIERHLRGESETYVAEYRIRRKDGEYIWILARAKAIFGEDGKPLRMVGAHADITERRQSEDLLSYQAAHDALTGLPNRRQFLALMQRAIESSEISSLPLTLCVCDIDYFKQVNDTYGHMTGDEVLIAFSGILREGVRRGDLVGRMGGDEFYLLFTATNVPDAVIVLERIKERWANTPFKGNGRNFKVTASFGAASLRAGMTSTELIEAADQTLYRAKMAGRNRVEFRRT